ncbi:MAG: M48 family metalloprotease [Pseudomonadota bacterium]
MIKKNLLLLSFSFLLTACSGVQTMAPQGSTPQIQAEQAKQKSLAYESFVNAQADLYRISLPILSSNAEFCGQKTRPATGISAWNIYAVPAEYQQTAQQLYGLGPELIVQNVVPNSPGQKAGLRQGDVLLSINGRPIPHGKNAIKTAQEFLDAAGYRQLELTYDRAGTKRTSTLTPVPACDYPVLLDNSSAINAYADGQRIVISRGITRFADNDSEIALVVAHELAHNTMEHVQKLKQNTMTGSLGGFAVDALLGAAGVNTGNQFSRIGGAIGQQRFSIPFEQEADYVGMYYLARAGFPTDQVANFWRRMASEGQASIDMRSSHPTSSERFIAIEQTHAEIQGKKKRNQALRPNFSN